MGVALHQIPVLSLSDFLMSFLTGQSLCLSAGDIMVMSEPCECQLSVRSMQR